MKSWSQALDWFAKQNSRAAPRRRYNESAWIRLGGSLVRECQVVDLSRTGVRLLVKNADSLPDTFVLVLSKGSTGRPARVRWRRGTQVGAEFVMANSSSASRLTTDPPKAGSSSASLLAPNTPQANSSLARRFVDDAPKTVNAARGEGQKSEKPMSSFSLPARAKRQEDLSNLKTRTRKLVGSVNKDKVKAEAHRQITAPSEQRDQVDREKNSKKRIDLSRLQKKLGPKHIALVHALRDVDPESPHGQELAEILVSLDERSD